MTNKERLDRIAQFIREHKYADLHTLAREFDISVSTVRRALNDLESQGTVRRHHGGASLNEDGEAENATGGYDFIIQDTRNADAKYAIAQAVAERIQPGMTVILDGGTTTYAVARQLVQKRVLIITNSLPIAALFSEIGSSETIVTGGTVYSRLGILYGPTCELALSHTHADMAVMGAAGITAEGIWNNNPFIVSVQNKMMAAAERTLFAVDSTKFGKRALNLTSGFQEGQTIVSEEPPPSDIGRALRKASVDLIIPQGSRTPAPNPSTP
ncbi:MAG: DeoR/GlpR family DNA-binding transcription regulator [Opitutales bacterium]